MVNPIELWKAEKHGLDVWPEVQRHAAVGTPMKQIDDHDLERMKWHGFFYRKRDQPGLYMTRIRVTAGELSAAQAKEVALLAYDCGHGIVDITTRANLQIQGIDIRRIPEVARRLEAVGLTARQTGHDNIRNVFGHPLSGVDPDELFDARSLCHGVTELFLNNREYSDLPRKLNICVSGAARHAAHYWTQDLSFLATKLESGEIAFRVLIGGTQGQQPRLAWHLPVLVYPEQVVDVSRAVIELFRAKGSREKRNQARLRFLMESIGVHGVLTWLEETLPYRLETYLEPPQPATAYEELVGWFPQKQPQRWAMGLNVPLGRLGWQQLEGLAILSRRWGDGQLRTTAEQGIAVINIPTGFRTSAATDAASLGLSVHADSLDRNTMACTGSQFCNIAVTETKGHMFQLMEKLRRRNVKLENIRIHMSGCPSSCAQHFTADIGLKGVRVRRLLGTREGFDVFLGGGVGGVVEMGIPFKLGVDVDQLPTLIEEVVADFYLRHRPGQTFSSYWRERLTARSADKADDTDYQLPVWVCDICQHHHEGTDPPTFCPRCAGLRRFFARLENNSASTGANGRESEKSQPMKPEEQVQGNQDGRPQVGPDGFVALARLDQLPEQGGLTVEWEGEEYALFREGDQVHAVEGLCPHEQAPLAEGEVRGGCVTCPWHGWNFDLKSGCSLEPPGHHLRRFETRVEEDQVFLKVPSPSGEDTETSQDSVARSVSTPSASASSASASTSSASACSASISSLQSRFQLVRSREATLKVLEVIDESDDVRTFRLDNRKGELELDVPGRFLRVGVTLDDQPVWRSFTVSSSPARPDTIDLTIKRNPEGIVSNFLFDNATPGASLQVKGPSGGFFFQPEKHPEPLLLISAGSGITPMISIARWLEDQNDPREVVFIHGARTARDILFVEESVRLAQARPSFQYLVSLSRPDDEWRGLRGRIDFGWISQNLNNWERYRIFLCGPDDMMNRLREGFEASGVSADRIHQEQFQAPLPAPVVMS
jgi:ferredoxin-nitrite reductase